MRITTRIALLEWAGSRVTPANLAGAVQVPAPPQGERVGVGTSEHRHA